jgi:hypothetical protein
LLCGCLVVRSSFDGPDQPNADPFSAACSVISSERTKLTVDVGEIEIE